MYWGKKLIQCEYLHLFFNNLHLWILFIFWWLKANIIFDSLHEHSDLLYFQCYSFIHSMFSHHTLYQSPILSTIVSGSLQPLSAQFYKQVLRLFFIFDHILFSYQVSIFCVWERSFCVRHSPSGWLHSAWFLLIQSI